MSNPYAYGVPVLEPAQFFGRQNELLEIFASIAQHACVNVVGERRIGKTSFLKHIAQPQVRQLYDSLDEDVTFVYIDPEIITPESPQGFFSEVLQQTSLAARLDGASGWKTDARRRWRSGTGSEAQQSDTGNVVCDERTMRDALEAIRPGRLVILVDEFEIVADNENFPFDFFEFLRGCSINYEISFILATSRPLAECCPQHIRSSPFPNIFQRLDLGPFTEGELDLFIQQTAEQSGAPLMNVRNDIAEMAGHFPYLVKMVSSLYYRAWSRGRELGPDLRSRIERQFMREARRHFGSLWDRYLTTEERSTLSAIAAGMLVSETHSDVVWSLHESGHLEDGRIASACFADFVRSREGGLGATDWEGALPSNQAPQIPPFDTSKGVWLDEKSGRVYIDGQVLSRQPTEKEYRLLKLLWDNRGGICNYYNVVLGVWGEDYIPNVDDQRIHALVGRLRKKIEPLGRPWRRILTLHGRGLALQGYAGAGEAEE